MSIWSKILPVAGGILGGVVGGPAGASAGSSLGGILGGAAGGASDERTQQNVFAGNNNAAATSRYGIQQGAATNLLALAEKAAMDRAALRMAAPDARTGQVVRGSLLANVQDANISHPRATIPKISGGLRPSALSPMAREAGHELQRQGYDALLTGSDVPAMPDVESARVTPPELEEYKSAGLGESALSTGSLLANIIAQLMRSGGGGGGGMASNEMDPISRAGLGLG